MGSLPTNVSSPSLALEEPSPAVEVSLVKSDGIEDPLESSDEDIVRTVEEEFARRLIWLDGDVYTGRVLVQIRNMALGICVMKYRPGI